MILLLLLACCAISISAWHSAHRSPRMCRYRRGTTMVSETNRRSSSVKTSIRYSNDINPVYENEFFGQMNFCLRDSDGALTGPSRSKILNSVTNNVFKAIVIGSISNRRRVLDKFDDYRIKVSLCEDPENCPVEGQTSEDVFSLMESKGNVTIPSSEVTSVNIITSDQNKRDATAALSYLDWLENLLDNGILHENTYTSTSPKNTTATTQDNDIVELYDRGYRRLLTLLRDAGCSFQDAGNGTPLPPPEVNICLSLLDQVGPETEISPTRELNRISNIVGRCMLYGSNVEKNTLAESIDARLPGFMDEYFEMEKMEDVQEGVYLQALNHLLRYGLASAQEQITGAYSNTGQFGESILEGTIGQVQLDSPPLRLYDSFTNAFQRVVEFCLSEIANRNVPQTNAQNEDILFNFVQWEQSLRRNLTVDMWAPNPRELSGTWELIDISGGGSLQNIMVPDAVDYFQLKQGILVELKDDGSISVDYDGVEGVRWFFKPGPAHLDTCEFSLRSAKRPDVILKYTGFIDRGQRIESRFSQQPIRMTGRVMSTIGDSNQGSCRFIMAKGRK